MGGVPAPVKNKKKQKKQEKNKREHKKNKKIKHKTENGKQKMKNDIIYGPGNITKALGINVEQDGENLLDGSIALSPRIHPVDRAIAKQRKNSKPRDKHLWRFTLVL